MAEQVIRAAAVVHVLLFTGWWIGCNQDKVAAFWDWFGGDGMGDMY